MTHTRRQRLFEYMHQEHGVTLLDSDIDEIKNILYPVKYPYILQSENQFADIERMALQVPFEFKDTLTAKVNELQKRIQKI